MSTETPSTAADYLSAFYRHSEANNSTGSRIVETEPVCSCCCRSAYIPGPSIDVLRIVGEIDLLTHRLITRALRAALDRDLSHLVVDLAGVTSCGARGFALFSDAALIARANATA
ncbi:MAG: STAS domain-containing protein [Pseudonocardiales bacterium]|nr:STAS domain-containing protein [Pseudonocardiales bacterium]